MPTLPTILRVGLVLAAVPGVAKAQIPPQSVLVATTATVVDTSLLAVNSTGAATTITGYGRLTHKSIALDLADPSAIWGLGGWPTIGSAPIGHYKMSGLRVTGRGAGDGILGAFGKVGRCHRYQDQLLITVTSVRPGLYRRALTGGRATLVAAIANPFDITVRRGKVYVTSLTSTTASAIFEVDMSVTPVRVRRVPISPRSGSIAAFKAIGTLGWEELARYLVVGDSAGKMWLIDPERATNNAFTLTFGISRGMAEAIMTHPDQRIGIVIATASGLYSQSAYNAGGRPYYTSKRTILDIAVLGGGSQTYGRGCTGAGGVPIHGHGLNGWPYHGNRAFTLEVENGPASTPGALIVGFDQTNIDLATIGAPNCSLYLNILLRVAITTDTVGKVVLPAAIPSNPSLIGSRVLTQWGLFEGGANSAGLITTAGLELVLR